MSSFNIVATRRLLTEVTLPEVADLILHHVVLQNKQEAEGVITNNQDNLILVDRYSIVPCIRVISKASLLNCLNYFLNEELPETYKAVQFYSNNIAYSWNYMYSLIKHFILLIEQAEKIVVKQIGNNDWKIRGHVSRNQRNLKSSGVFKGLKFAIPSYLDLTMNQKVQLMPPFFLLDHLNQPSEIPALEMDEDIEM